MTEKEGWNSFSRKDRKALEKIIKKARQSGDWGAWEEEPMPASYAAHIKGGRLFETHRLLVNRLFQVMIGPMGETGITHLGVMGLQNMRPTFHEMQRMKNELTAPGRQAVEIYPPQDALIDRTDMWHLWVLPAGLLLPFGLK